MLGDQAQVLIVCTGNICRSPFIERLLQHRLDERLSGSGARIVVHSAGTGALVGSAMEPHAAAELRAHGGDPSGFSARGLTSELVAASDLVLTATREHRGKVARLSPAAMRRVFTFRDFAHLVAGIDVSGDPTGAASGPIEPVRQDRQVRQVRQVTAKAAASRGLKPPLVPDLADIVDPYRREDEVFTIMAQQITDAMPAVVRALVG